MEHPKDEILIDLLLDELTESEVRMIREHLDMCDDCSKRVREIMVVMSYLDEFDEVEPSRSIRLNVMSRLGFIDISKLQAQPSRMDIYKGARRNRGGLRVAASVAILILGLYMWQVFAPQTLSELYGYDFTSAKLEAPTVVQPENVIPVSIGVLDDTGRVDRSGRVREVTIELASNEGTVLSREIQFKAGEMVIEQVDLRGVESGSYELRASIKGSELISKPIVIEKSFDIKIDMDRPIYRPGDKIRLRVQARQLGGSSAEGERTVFVMRCPIGSLVTHKEVELNEYGVGEFGYHLADIVPIGEYMVSVRVGSDKVERIVYVDTFKKPKFLVTVESENDYITWSGGLSGRVKSEYFFGKPVSNGEIHLDWHIVEGGVLRRALSLSDKSDEFGVFRFTINPQELGSEYNPGDNEIIESYIAVTVVDSVGRKEKQIRYVPYTRHGSQVRLYPEGGKIIPHQENRFYVLVSDPNGLPVVADLEIEIDGDKFTGHTSDSGLYTFKYKPDKDRFSVVVSSKQASNKADIVRFPLSARDSDFPFIVRSLRAVYNFGDELEIDLMVPSPWNNRVQLNLFKGDTWIASRDVEIVNDTTRINWRIPPVTGELTIEANLWSKLNYLSKDRTRIIVGDSKDISVGISLDSEVYSPGSVLNADISVNRGGEPQQSSVGVNVSDKKLIESGRRAESSSKIQSDSVLSGLENRLTHDLMDETDRQNITRALLSSRSEIPGYLDQSSTLDLASIDLEKEASKYHLSLIGNYPFIYIRSMLAGLLYIGVLLTLVTSIININRARTRQLILGTHTIWDMRSFAIITSVAVVLLSTAIYFGNKIVLVAGFLITIIAVLRLMRCVQRDDLIANISTLAQIFSVFIVLVASLLLAHQGIWNPVLRDLSGVHPFLDIAFMSVLAMIGFVTILSTMFISNRGGETI